MLKYNIINLHYNIIYGKIEIQQYNYSVSPTYWDMFIQEAKKFYFNQVSFGNGFTSPILVSTRLPEILYS